MWCSTRDDVGFPSKKETWEGCVQGTGSSRVAGRFSDFGEPLGSVWLQGNSIGNTEREERWDTWDPSRILQTRAGKRLRPVSYTINYRL